MKKILIIIILLTVCSAHAQTDEKENLKQLNQKVHVLYRSQKFDDALKLARQAVDLSLRIYGTEQPETAETYRNLGVMHQETNKYKQSTENLQKAVNIYRKMSDSKYEELVLVYQILACSQFLDNKKEESEVNYFKAIEAAENRFGKESKESFLATLNLANIYAGFKDFEKANEFYLKSYALAKKKFGRESNELEQVEDSRSCLVSAQRTNRESEKAFIEARKKIIGENDEQGSRIINGKAKSLPLTPYPFEAKSRRISGMVSVRVKIDRQGNVIEARNIRGHPLLGQSL
jgi:tetratricopeptide (TPR) repeat protein